jgi:O-antigen ligase
VVEVPPGRLDHALFAGFCAVLLFGPLAFGAVEAWSVFALQAGAALLLLLWAARHIAAGRLSVPYNPLYAPMLLLGVIVAAQLLFGLSAYRYATWTESLRYLAYALLVLVAAQVLGSREGMKRFALVLSVFGFLVALFAIVQDLAPNGKLYWVRQPRVAGWMFGPYVNHAHYAGLMEMLTPFPLVLALTSHFTGAKRILIAFAAVVMGGSIFFSGSRGGMAAFAAEILFLAWVLSRRKRQAERRTLVLLAAVVLLTVVFLGVFARERVFQQIATLDAPLAEGTTGMRLHIDRDGLRMFAARPLAGWGLGTFPYFYPQFRTFYTNTFINQAHNDYLQFLVETGALGFAACLWFLVALFYHGVKRSAHWQESMTHAVRMAALAGCAGLLVHSFFDFNLQIPANAAFFYVLAVTATAEREDNNVILFPQEKAA